MAMSEEQFDDLDKKIQKARQKPVNYGLSLGKKPQDTVMIVDLLKPPATLMRKAKAEGETPKVTFGTFEVKGKIMTLVIEGKMLPGLAKNMKQFMVKTGRKFKIIIVDPNGEELESDGDESEFEDGETEDLGNEEMLADEAPETPEAPEPESEPESAEAAEPEPENTEEVAEDDPLGPQWVAVKGKLDPMVTQFAASSDPRAPAVAKAWDGAATAAEGGKFKDALAVAKKLAPIVSVAPTETSETESQGNEEQQEVVDELADVADDPNKPKWEAISGPLTNLFMKAIDLNPHNRSNLESRFAVAMESADMGDYAKAIKVAQLLKPLLDDAISFGQSDQTDEIAEGTVKFQQASMLWRQTRSKMMSEMANLENAIVAMLQQDEDLADVAKEAKELTSRLNVFDDRLENALNEITQTPPGEKRKALMKQAAVAIKDYHTTLNEPFFKDVDNNNGFAKVTVTETAMKSLQGIAKTLAA